MTDSLSKTRDGDGIYICVCVGSGGYPVPSWAAAWAAACTGTIVMNRYHRYEPVPSLCTGTTVMHCYELLPLL
jgi:hypothetical protein